MIFVTMKTNKNAVIVVSVTEPLVCAHASTDLLVPLANVLSAPMTAVVMVHADRTKISPTTGPFPNPTSLVERKITSTPSKEYTLLLTMMLGTVVCNTDANVMLDTAVLIAL